MTHEEQLEMLRRVGEVELKLAAVDLKLAKLESVVAKTILNPEAITEMASLMGLNINAD